MKNILSIRNLAIVVAFLFTSCDGTGTGSNISGIIKNLKTVSEVQGSNPVGDWYYEITRDMGGYQISSKTKLTILRNGSGDYEFKLIKTVVDAMYGGQPKTEYSSGRFEQVETDNKWHFIGGDYGDRGAYIAIPSDNRNNYKPSEIIIHFNTGRGNTMSFKRY